MSENILEINNLSKYFGGLAAVSDCSLKVKKGTITGIIGPNGSGKTTLFNLIAGNLKSSTGSVFFNNENITDIPSYELFSKGLLRTFQIAHEFTNLSVRKFNDGTRQSIWGKINECFSKTLISCKRRKPNKR